MDEKEITNATNMLAIQYFVAYSKMKELTGDPVFCSVQQNERAYRRSRRGDSAY